MASRNREVQEAARALEGARAGVVVAGQAPNPTLSWSGTSINPRSGVGGGSLKDKRIDQTLSLSQLIERGDKRELRQAGAEALVRSAEADLADMRRRQRYQLHQAYFDLKAAQERVRLFADAARLYGQSLEAGQKRLAAGDVAAVDVARLKVDALRTANDARGAEAELAKARKALGYLIGRDGDADGLEAADPWPVPAAIAGRPPVERRPDLRSAEMRVAAAEQARQLARSLTKRDVTVGAQVERFPPEPGVTYGISLSVPIFARYGFEGEVARAENDYTAALEAREKVLALAESEVARARADLDAAAEKLARVEGEVLPAARQVATAAEFAYRKGAMGLIDLLDARRTLRAVELDAVAIRADHAKARAAWLAATEWGATEEP